METTQAVARDYVSDDKLYVYITRDLEFLQ